MAELYTCARFRVGNKTAKIRCYTVLIIQYTVYRIFLLYLDCRLLRLKVFLIFLNVCYGHLFQTVARELQTLQAWNRQALHWFASHLPESIRDNVEHTIQ